MISKNLYLVKKEKVHLSWPFLTVLLCGVSTGHLCIISCFLEYFLLLIGEDIAPVENHLLILK